MTLSNAIDSGPLFSRDRDWHPAAYTPGYKTSMTRAPFRPLVALGSTLSEETGPAFGQSMIGRLDNNLILNFTGQPAVGERIIMHGRVLDEQGRGVPNVLVEIWQANAGGRYRHKKDGYLAPLDPNFQGFAKVMTGPSGEWRVITIKPSGYDSPIGHRTPHIHFDIKGRHQRLITQMYFSEDHATNSADQLYNQLGEDSVTAMAAVQAADRYRWDIVLGEG